MIPKNLDDCLKCLNQELAPETVQQFKEIDEREAIATTHHSLGQWIRNNWGLWNNKGELHNWFKDTLGIWHADDMSGIILTSFHRKLNGKDIDLEAQVQLYKDFWAESSHSER